MRANSIGSLLFVLLLCSLGSGNKTTTTTTTTKQQLNSTTSNTIASINYDVEVIIDDDFELLSNTSARVDDAFMASRRLHALEFVSFPVLFALGSISNVLTVAVAVRRSSCSSSSMRQQQSAYVYMSAVAVVDETVLVAYGGNFWLFLFNGHLVTHVSDAACKLASLVFVAALHSSAWLLVLMAADRLVSMHTQSSSSSSSVKTAGKLVVALVVVVVVADVHIAYSHGLRTYDRTVMRCEVVDERFVRFMERAWPWIHAGLYSLVPLALLAVANSLIVRKLRMSSHVTNDNNNNNNNTKETQSDEDENETNETKATHWRFGIVLLAVTVLLFLTTAPTLILHTFYSLSSSSSPHAHQCGDAGLHDQTLALVLQSAVATIQYLNHAAKLLIYVVFDKHFRHSLCALFATRRQQQEREIRL